jgi:hypothetical protein
MLLSNPSIAVSGRNPESTKAGGEALEASGASASRSVRIEVYFVEGLLVPIVAYCLICWRGIASRRVRVLRPGWYVSLLSKYTLHEGNGINGRDSSHVPSWSSWRFASLVGQWIGGGIPPA